MPTLFIQTPETNGNAVINYFRRLRPTVSMVEINQPLTTEYVKELEKFDFVYGAVSWPEVEKYFLNWRKFTLLENPVSRVYEYLVAHCSEDQPLNALTLERVEQLLRQHGVYDAFSTGYVTQFTSEQLRGSTQSTREQQVEQALANLRQLDAILIAEKLHDDLPIACSEFGYGTADFESEQRLSANWRLIASDLPTICEHVQRLCKADRDLYFLSLETQVVAPSVHRRIRPLVAFVSPIFPDAFGVPVYSLLTTKALAPFARIDLVNEVAPSPSDAGHLNAHLPPSAAKSLASYDARVFVFGNNSSLHHAAVTAAENSKSGVCVYHDPQMLDTTSRILGRNAARKMAEQSLGHAITSAEFDGWFTNRSMLPHPLFPPLGDGRFIDVVHSPVQQAIHRSFYPASNPVYLPHAIQHTVLPEQITPLGRMATRALLSIPPEQLVIASCGAVQSVKRTSDILFALAHLHEWGIKAHLYFVGTIHDSEDRRLGEQADLFGIRDFIHFTGALSEEKYMHYLVASDVAVQLRLTLFGQLSGALIDCVAAGLPTLAPISLAAALEAPSFVARVPDEFTSVDVANGLCHLLEGRRDKVNLDEWRSFVDEHSFERYGQRTAALLQI